MTHHASSTFWSAHRKLPRDVQALADRNYALLKTNPGHPSLHFKKIGALWSVRVGLHYRALAAEADGDLVWFWIGAHADYDRLVGRRPASSEAKPTGRARRTAKPRKRP